MFFNCCSKMFWVLSLLVIWEASCLRVNAAEVEPNTHPERPNIVLIAVDTVRADHLGCYGYHRPTSTNIDRLAEQGVLFERCYSPASWTLPAFMSMFTGHQAAVHGVMHSNLALAASIPTFAQRLKEAGYYNAAVVSNPYLNAKYGFGRGFDIYDDYSVFLDAELSLLAVDGAAGGGSVNTMVTGDAVTQQAKWLLRRAAESGKPFFLFVHYFDPHDSYIPPPPYDRMFDPDYEGAMNGHGVTSMRDRPPAERDLQHLIARYDGEIAYEDKEIGKLLDVVDRLGDPSQTITILMSDHGEAWGEHGKLLHGNAPYREEVWVPMIWRWPGVLPSGQRVAMPVSSMDIPVTLLELLGLPQLPQVPSVSLGSILREGGSNYKGDVFSERALGSDQHIALTHGDLRLHARFEKDLRDARTLFEAYDLAQDPWEQTNLYLLAPKRFDTMRKEIERIWYQAQELRASLASDRRLTNVQWTEEERRRMEGLGYTEAK